MTIKEEHRMQYHYLNLYLTKERKKIMNKIDKLQKENSSESKQLIILLSFRSDWLRIQSENIYNTKLKG
jgi:hypothetical protein